MGTSGHGPFDSDAALDLLDELTAQESAVHRRQTVEQILRLAREHPEDMGRKISPGEVVAAVAVVVAGLPDGQDMKREIAEWGYGAASLISGEEPALADDALAALLIAAGDGGAWHQGWVTAADALQARRTTEDLASVLNRHRHRKDHGPPTERP